MNRTFLVAAALAAACHRNEAPPPAACGDCQRDANAHVLRTYQVPPGQEKVVEKLLRGNHYPVSERDDKGVVHSVFVSLSPQFTGNGFFVLSAPPSMQDGVRELLDELKAHPPQAGSAQTIDSTFWLVLGWPAGKPDVPPELGEVSPALDELVKIAPMRFELYDKLRVASLDGDEARAQSNRADLEQTAAVDKDGIELRLKMRVFATPGPDREEELTTALRVKPGQFAVLGQSGAKPKDVTTPSTVPPTLFYIVRSVPQS